MLLYTSNTRTRKPNQRSHSYCSEISIHCYENAMRSRTTSKIKSTPMIQSCPLMPAFLRTWVIFFWAAANRLFVLSISASSSLSIWFCVPSSSPICRPICPNLTTCSPRWSKSSSCCLQYIIHTHAILTQMNIEKIFLQYLFRILFFRGNISPVMMC